MPKHITIPQATHAEAKRRIDNVLGPYIDNLHPMHEASFLSIVRDMRDYLYAEFDDFGFEYIDLMGDKP